MKRVCSWCKKDMGTKPGGEGVSHGICPSCLEKLEAERDGPGGARVSIPPLPAPPVLKTQSTVKPPDIYNTFLFNDTFVDAEWERFVEQVNENNP